MTASKRITRGAKGRTLFDFADDVADVNTHLSALLDAISACLAGEIKEGISTFLECAENYNAQLGLIKDAMYEQSRLNKSEGRNA